MKLKNLKASFILKEKVPTLPKVKNVTFKQDNFTFNIYHHSPCLVNVTGVKTFERLKLARQIIEKKLQQSVLKVRIDNTFYSQKNYRNVDLIKVLKIMIHFARTIMLSYLQEYTFILKRKIILQSYFFTLGHIQ